MRQRVDPVLAPDQFSVAQPLAPENLDRCVTRHGLYPSLPAPNGVLWSEYIRSQRNRSRSVSSSTEALDSDHARFITSQIAQHARTMATSTRSLPTNSPVPYFQPIEGGPMSEGKHSDMGSLDVVFAMDMQIPSQGINLPRTVSLPEGTVHHPVAESDILMTYTGLDDYDTLFEARHGRGALEQVPRMSEEKYISSMGAASHVLGTGVGVQSKDKEKSLVDIEPLHQNDSVPMMIDPLTNRMGSPSSDIIGEGVAIFTNMTETMLTALDHDNSMKMTQGKTQMVSDPKDAYPDLFLPVTKNHQISDRFCGYSDSLSADNNSMVLVELNSLSYWYGTSIYAINRVNGTMYGKFSVGYRMIPERLPLSLNFNGPLWRMSLASYNLPMLTLYLVQVI